MMRRVGMVELLVFFPFGEEVILASSLLKIGGLGRSEVLNILGHDCLVVEGSYIDGGSLLPLEYLIDFNLCPCKHAVLAKLFGKAPPKSSFEEALDHIGVIPASNKCLVRLVLFITNCRRFQIQI